MKNKLLDCPYLFNTIYDRTNNYLNEIGKKMLDLPCMEYGHKSDNWICLTCKHIACSIFKAGHMSIHAIEKKHHIAMNSMDGSLWCNQCELYITNSKISE